jgi:hypothetical protein
VRLIRVEQLRRGDKVALRHSGPTPVLAPPLVGRQYVHVHLRGHGVVKMTKGSVIKVIGR